MQSMPSLLAGTTSQRMDRSFAYTLEQARIWRRRANGHSNSQQALYAVALPTSAVAAYFAITGDRGESAITALTATSGSAFALSRLSQSRPRQRVYLAGADALTCVLWRAAPLAMPDGTYQDVKLQIADISGQADKVAVVSRALIAANASLNDPDMNGAVVAALEDAKTESQSAMQTAGAAGELLALVDAAPVQVLAQTQKIASAVSQQLVALEPDPDAVLDVARTMKSSFLGLKDALAPPAKTSEEQKTASGSEVAQDAATQTARNALLTLQAETARLGALRARLAANIAAHRSAMTKAGSLDGCTATSALQPVSISPATANPKVKAGTSYNLVLSGGSGAFDVRVTGGNTKGVTISYQNSPYPSRYPIVNFGEDASGAVSVSIRDVANPDDAGAEIAFEVGAGNDDEIKDKGAGNGSGRDEVPLKEPDVPPDTASGRVIAFSCPSLDQGQTAIVQLALLSVRRGARDNASFVDGAWGPATDHAAQFYWQDRLGAQLPGDGVDCAFGRMTDRGSEEAGILLQDALANFADEALISDATRDRVRKSCRQMTIDRCWSR